MTSRCLYRKSTALLLWLVTLAAFWPGTLAQAAARGGEALVRIDKMVQVKGGLLQKLVDAAPGDIVTFVLSVSNYGSVKAANIALEDQLPKDLLYLDKSASSTCAVLASSSSGLKWNIASLDAKAFCVVSYQAQVNPDVSRKSCGRELVNVASVNVSRASSKTVSESCSGGLSESDCNPTSDRASVRVTCPPPEPKLKVNKWSEYKGDLKVGSILTYYVEIENIGSTEALNVAMKDALPAGLVLQGSPQIKCQSACDAKDPLNVVEASIPSMKPGEICQIWFNAKVTEEACGKALINQASVSAKDLAAPILSKATNDAVYCEKPNLSLVKDAKLEDGRQILYTLTLKNTGQIDIQSSIEITDPLSDLTQMVEIKISSASVWEYSWPDKTNPLKIRFPAGIKAGEACTITFRVKVLDQAKCGDVIRNTAQVKVSDSLGVTSNTTEIKIDCAPPRLELHKSADRTSVVRGGTIQYTLVVKNVGGSAARNLVVTDSILAPTTLDTQSVTTSNCGDGCSVAVSDATPSLLKVQINELKADQTCTIKFTVKVNERADCGKTVSNTAQVSFENQTIMSVETTSVSILCPPYQIIGSIDLGCDPVSGAINPLTHEAVITTGLINQAVIVDLVAQRVAAYVTMDTPHGVAINEQTNQAVITNLWSNTATILDLAKRTVLKKVRVGSTPRGVAVNSKTNVAVVANNGSNSVSIIDLGSGIVSSTIRVGLGPDSVAIDPEMNLAAISNAGEDSVSLVDLKEKKVVKTISALNNPLGVAFNTSNDLLYVVNQGNAKLSQIDAFNLQAAKVNGNITVGSRYSMPEQVVVDADTSRAVVSNFNDHAVVFVDLVAGTLLATVDMLQAGGRGPRGLALDQELGLVLVVHQQSNIIVLVSM